MDSEGRVGEMVLLLPILGWSRGDEVNSTSARANLQAGSWSMHLCPGPFL